MKKLLLSLTILTLLSAACAKSQNSSQSLPISQIQPTYNSYKNPKYGYSFSYPATWKFSTEELPGSVFRHILTAPTSLNETEGKLTIRVNDMSLADFTMGKCPKDRESGNLTIEGKSYIRCDNGSGLHLFSLSLINNDVLYSFEYSTPDSESKNTKTIEKIIESLKFQ